MKKVNNGYRLIASDTDMERGLTSLIPSSLSIDDVFFICIGTDKSTGDALGPMIGTALEEKGYSNVIGTLNQPIHATNLNDTLKTIPFNKQVIAIDACLGRFKSVETVSIGPGPLKPGSGVGKDLPEVGDYYIKGIVNVSGFMEFFILQNTRLKVVKDLVDIITYGITKRFPLERKEELICLEVDKKSTCQSLSVTN